MSTESGGDKSRKFPGVFSWKVLPWVILVLSVGLNVFFVGGHYYGRHVAKQIIGKENPRLADRLERKREMRRKLRRAIRDLNLTEEQRTAFREMRRTMAQSGRDLRQKNRAPLGKLWAEFETGKPNDVKVEALLREMADNRYAFQLEATRLASRFMGTLTPEQRTKFATLARERNIFARFERGRDGRGSRQRQGGTDAGQKPPPISGTGSGDPRKEE